MADIYEQLLNAPECWIPVARPDGQGGWMPPEAPIRLVETDKGTVQQPLLEVVDQAIFQMPTIAALRKLFDNFNPKEGEPNPDLESVASKAEIDAFLDAVMDTFPMRTVASHLKTEDPAQFPDDLSVRSWARQVWFDSFTNEHAAKEPHCVGFEHVFVGEVQQGAHAGDNKMDIGGYHSWIKYATDQANGLVKYKGHDYPPAAADRGKANTREASVIMTWNVLGEEYLKNPGGFFVGDLPEMQIALGIVGLYDSMKNRFGGTGSSGKSTDRKVVFGEDFIDLVVYPQTVNNGGQRSTGDHLRSMFAKFRGNDQAVTHPGGGEVPLPHTPQNAGPLQIVRALPNPPGTDDTGEWVEIKNATDHILTLDNWTLRDAQQRSTPLAGSLAAGETLRINLDRVNDSSVQLANGGGWIFLYEGTERIAAVRYSSAASGQVVEF